MRRPLLVLPVLLAALVLAACGRGDGRDGSEAAPTVIGAKGKATDKDTSAESLGIPSIVTKNTTRLAGSDPVSDAAGAARAVFSANTRATRPKAVVLVDRKDWQGALAASALMSSPANAPILFTDGREVPDATTEALRALAPTGSRDAGGAQLIRIGAVPRLARYKTTDVRGGAPSAVGRAVDTFVSGVRGNTSDSVLVVSAEHPEYAAPAAAYAAKSGDPILFVGKAGVPKDTVAALRTHQQPKIYVLGPSRIIPPATTKQLRRYGTVKRIGGQTPVSNAVAFARYSDGDFGWGVTNPGHGFVISRTTADPAIAAGVAPLSVSGTYGPLVLNDEASALSGDLRDYLSALRPGYSEDPVRGVYNRAWLVGDDTALSGTLQSTVDDLLEIRPVTSTQ